MTSDLDHVVSTFYDAMATGDTTTLASLIDSSFAESATMHRPESLPGGGTLTGRDRILRFLERAAGRVPMSLLQSETNSAGTELFAHIDITIGHQAVRALEWWTVENGLVSSIRAFYWDTAAMVTPQ